MIIVLTGPTAAGKTDLSIQIAKDLNGEIVSADSMQVYQKMDIGTAKPTIGDQNGVKHHLIDEVSPKESFSVSLYKAKAVNVINEIISRGKLPIIVGGTGFYIDSLFYSIDTESIPINNQLRAKLLMIHQNKGSDYLFRVATRLSPQSKDRLSRNDTKRLIRSIEVSLSKKAVSNENPAYDKNKAIFIGLTYDDRKLLYERIDARVDNMINNGLLDEVRDLHGLGLLGVTASQAIGYKELLSYLKGELTLEEAVDLIKRNSRRYAKRQLTWFRRKNYYRWFYVDSFHSKAKMNAEILEIIKGDLSFL